ncbi:ATP-binding protein [Sulfurovum riftiae]|nr:ATP-binding protein [Sulfurovum riftiae]
MVFFFFFFYINEKQVGVGEGKKGNIQTVPKEKYHLLENKFKALFLKAEKLEKENKTTELFLASMSHEIRTPLNGIVGLTELLDGTELTEEQKEFVSMIRESSHNLNVIVNDILDVSKINAGKMELENIEFDLFTKMEASVGMFVPKIEEKGIVLNLFTDPKIPSHVIGDPTRLSQVIINLVSNAVKFTEKAGKIDLFAEYVKEKPDTVTFKVSVADSGIGLTKEQQARIFEAYSQAEASTTRKAGGTGLGLTISSKIIKSMGSELKVKSKEGAGSTFFFTLTLPKGRHETKEILEISDELKVGVVCSDKNPKSQWNMILQKYIQFYGADYQNYRDKNIFSSACPDILLIDHTTIDTDSIASFEYLSCKRVLLTSSTLHTNLGKERQIFDEIVYMPITFEKIGKILQLKKGEDLASRSRSIKNKSLEKAEKKSFENIHVLVAEDNPINQKLIKIVLENFGLTVTLASNGEEAYEYRKKHKYDMIFMDIQMPVMGGVESTHRILEYEKEQGLEHIPIIALTANALSGDKEKYISEGMDDYATKPLDIKVIEKLVSKYCVV